jgi:glutathione S-transferase
MKFWLFYSTFHTFAHKVLVTAHECGLWDDIVFVPTFPFRNTDGVDVSGQYSIANLNPLDKVPTLALETGQLVYGSQAVCEVLDHFTKPGANKIYPDAGPDRWDAITRLAMCDTIFESTVQMVMEQWNPQESWRIGLFEWLWPKFIRGLDKLEGDAQRGWTRFDIGHAAMLHMISYLGFRAEFYEAKDPLYPNFKWRDGRPALSAWFDQAIARPSVQSHLNKSYEGDSSAEFHQAQVAAILAIRKAKGLA